MKAFELFEAVGRESQHLEDILYIEGTASAINTIQQLKSVIENPKRLGIKYDGSPAVRFGRDVTGAFHFADKYAKSMISTPDELKKYYMDKVKGEPSESRLEFVGMMTKLHSIFERGTPQSFRGFVHADLLWSSTPPKNNRGEYVFEPNTVRYFVDADTSLGKMIGASTAGAAAVMYQDSLDDKFVPIGNQWQSLGSDELVIVGPISAVETTVDVDTKLLDKLTREISANQSVIEQFIEPEPGLADIRAIIYNFINQQAASGVIKDLSVKFPKWVSDHPKLSSGKKEKVLAKLETNTSGAKALFDIIEKTIVIKKKIIQQLEQPTLKTVGIRAELIDGTPGGEGFVDETGMKLVDRETFSKANFGKQR